MDGAFSYDAFIAFAGSSDGSLARALADALKQLGLRLFLDDTVAGPVGGFVGRLRGALLSSRSLIVLASRASAESLFVREALREWLEPHGNGRIIPVLVEAELGELFPGLAALQYVDFRGVRHGTGFVVPDDQFDRGVRTIAARLSEATPAALGGGARIRVRTWPREFLIIGMLFSVALLTEYGVRTTGFGAILRPVVSDLWAVVLLHRRSFMMVLVTVLVLLLVVGFAPVVLRLIRQVRPLWRRHDRLGSIGGVEPASGAPAPDSVQVRVF